MYLASEVKSFCHYFNIFTFAIISFPTILCLFSMSVLQVPPCSGEGQCAVEAFDRHSARMSARFLPFWAKPTGGVHVLSHEQVKTAKELETVQGLQSWNWKE